MDDETLKFLSHKVANALMRAHGFDRRDKEHKIEFDNTNPDSQYSMMFYDADIAVRTTIESLMEIGEDGVPETEDVAVSAPDETVDLGEPEHQHDHGHEHSHDHEHDHDHLPDRISSIFIDNSSTVICKETPSVPMTIQDVEDWLQIMRNSGAGDDLKVTGYLHGEVKYTIGHMPT